MSKKFEDVMANLEDHNRKNAIKVVAKAIALNVVVPVVAVVVTKAVIDRLNK